MDKATWRVTFLVHRQKGPEPPHFDQFTLDVSPDEYVLDAIERIWAFHDRSLTFRHACHHGACGACGVRINGVERLNCLARIADVTRDGGRVKVEPLRSFPVVSDLVVDMSRLYGAMERVGFRQVVPVCAASEPGAGAAGGAELRLADCIECGLCLSACPVTADAPQYLEPAALAAVHQGIQAGDESLYDLADSSDGVWRCHNAFACMAVCPADISPAQRIMSMRRQIVGRRLQRLVRPRKETQP